MPQLSQPLLPHQQKVLEKISDPNQHGLIIWHGLGSGKTRSSIESYKSLNPDSAIVALPKSLEENYLKELDKWDNSHSKKQNLSLLSQQLLGRLSNTDKLNPDMLIVDEAHRARTSGTNLNKALTDLAKKSNKVLLLTGTPVYNKPNDISALVNMAAGKDVLPVSDADFAEKYIDKKKVYPSLWKRFLGVTPGEVKSLKNKDKLKSILEQYVDYYPGSKEHFPDISTETVKVEMSPEQVDIYNTVLKKIPWVLRKKIQLGMPANKRETEKLVAFLSGLRALSNSSSGFVLDENKVHSPKIDKAYENLQKMLKSDPGAKAIVYSNYLNNGVNIYKALLEKDKIPYGEFSGEVKNSVRDKLVKEYNKNKLKVLLLSSAGGEGLDLKGTRLVQLLEPHFNNEKINQVIGRAARYKSHDELPEDKRKVLVQHYLSQLPKTGWLIKKRDMSTDEYLQQMADDKQKLNNQVLDLIKSASSTDKEIAPADHLLPTAIAGGILGSGVSLAYMAIKDTLNKDQSEMEDPMVKRKRVIKNMLIGAGIGALGVGAFNTYDNISRNAKMKLLDEQLRRLKA
jgi:superfamily II DNA or RNA helicase